MRDNDKAPASVCETQAEASTETTAESTSISDSNSITEKEKKQASIAAILPLGEENAISAKDLTAIVGAPSVRALQMMIAKECAATDALILSTGRNGGGYYLPQQGEAGREEIQRFIKTLTERARHTFFRLRAARRALRVLDGQSVIDGGHDEWKS